MVMVAFFIGQFCLPEKILRVCLYYSPNQFANLIEQSERRARKVMGRKKAKRITLCAARHARHHASLPFTLYAPRHVRQERRLGTSQG